MVLNHSETFHFFSIVKRLQIMQKLIEKVVWMQTLNKFHWLKISDIVTKLLRNINNLKSVKKSKN